MTPCKSHRLQTWCAGHLVKAMLTTAMMTKSHYSVTASSRSFVSTDSSKKVQQLYVSIYDIMSDVCAVDYSYAAAVTESARCAQLGAHGRRAFPNLCTVMYD